ncbi:hypothetical protein FSP39_013666 [Pinctada imbricata]|uniref:Uncharacterized protein n=1 Tax=Pinctada imbricata TaxID=66713 RepID=A0AA88XMB0_PINIB|nr:hypothetical protein FSP39_013666 [Pinctada imbricata]
MLHVPLINKLYDYETQSDAVPSAMKEFRRRSSLGVIDESNNNDAETLEISEEVTPRITVTPCDDAIDSASEISSACSSRSGSETDLHHLKVTATRLRLTTRRPSYVEWREKYVERPRRRSKPEIKVEFDENGNDTLTEDRKHRINEALEWIKDELKEMRSQDQILARKLLSLRQDIHQLKLKRSCQEHREIIEDVQTDLEENQQTRSVCDLPTNSVENPLKHLGVTSYNFTARRFSTC